MWNAVFLSIFAYYHFPLQDMTCTVIMHSFNNGNELAQMILCPIHRTLLSHKRSVCQLRTSNVSPWKRYEPDINFVLFFSVNFQGNCPNYFGLNSWHTNWAYIIFVFCMSFQCFSKRKIWTGHENCTFVFSGLEFARVTFCQYHDKPSSHKQTLSEVWTSSVSP